MPLTPDERAARAADRRERDRSRPRSGRHKPAPPEQIAAYEAAAARVAALRPGEIRPDAVATDLARVLRLPYGSLLLLRQRSLPRVLARLRAAVAEIDAAGSGSE